MVKGRRPELCFSQGHRMTRCMLQFDVACNSCGYLLGSGHALMTCLICGEYHLCTACEDDRKLSQSLAIVGIVFFLFAIFKLFTSNGFECRLVS